MSDFESMLAALLKDSTAIDKILHQHPNTTGSSLQGSKVCVTRLPPIDAPDELVQFFEARIKPGCVAHCRLFTEINSDKCKGTAIVHFKSQQDASCAINLARTRQLTFKGQPINAFPAKKDARKRNGGVTGVDDVVLHAGCLIQKHILYKLWTCYEVRIEVDNDGKKFRVIIRNANPRTTYKLEWRFREIHEFCRCKNRRGHMGQTFMLRVWYSPQISELSSNGNQYVCPDLFGALWDDIYEPIWVRTTDFSPEASFGQSFVYCLEVSQEYSGVLDDFINTVSEFPQQENNLMIKDGPSYSVSLQTVPILNSPYLDRLPFELVFLVNSLVQLGYLTGPSLGRSFFRLLTPSRSMPLQYIIHILKKLRREEDTCFEPEQWFNTEAQKFLEQGQKERLTKYFIDDGLVMIRKVYVTPLKVYCVGPEVDVSNRVTRHFIDHIDDFIRVAFVEEDSDLIPASALVVAGMRGSQNNVNKVYDRIVSVLNDGISIGGKEFEFLAFSTSQLRENSVWMFSANTSVTAEDIRHWMGDFLGIRNIAKCASRMGQSFSSSTKSLDVPADEIKSIDDIWNTDHTYCFSDGVGKISARFATQVAKKCKLKNEGKIPSLYQIRYGGYKGVVAVDPTSHHKLSLRPTMHKFPSSQISLDILNWSRLLPSYLNREIITLLSTLGVPDSVFQKMQGEVMQQLDAMLENSEVAVDVIQAFCGGSNTHQIMIEMLQAGFYPASEPFLTRMLHTFRAFQFMNLRKKTRIFVPKGCILMGCLDETRTLNYGQVFISVSPTSRSHKVVDDGLHFNTVYGINNVPQNVCIVKGRVFVAKNPCVHPGDVRVLTAIDVPGLHHLVDCVVFPQKGPRSHPSECSGSDLDGDLYFVSWDSNLIPPKVHPPQDYQPAPEQKLDRPVTTQDITKYFADFMVNNSLGLISNAHVVFADLSPQMACDPKCLELAKLCSIAVDFPKTGVPAVLPMELRPKTYPDFMEKPDKPQYVSEKILGKLFRAVVEAGKDEKITSFTRQEAARSYDKQLEVGGFRHYLEEAEARKNCYDERLLDLMYQYDVKSEAEMFTGHILSLSRWFRKRPGEAKERMMRAMSSLRKEARSWLKDPDEGAEDDDDNDEGVCYEKLAKASAWYHVTYHPHYVPHHAETKYGHLLSFPWVVYDKLVLIKKWGLGSA